MQYSLNSDNYYKHSYVFSDNYMLLFNSAVDYPLICIVVTLLYTVENKQRVSCQLVSN